MILNLQNFIFSTKNAFTHGSYELELTANQDHIRNTLSNAGIKNPRWQSQEEYNAKKQGGGT